MAVNWYEPVIGKREQELVSEVLKSGYLSEGPMCAKLEEQLKEVVHAKHIILTTSCTSALHLAIEADKKIRNYTHGTVLVPDLTFISTKNVVENSGLTPMICDVDKDNYTLSKQIRTDNYPMIIIPVNLLGRRHATQEELNLTDWATIICDNAGALGSNVPNGKVGCYSLQVNKIITSGQGGFCATDDDEYAAMIRRLKDFGRVNKTDNISSGFNYKFNDIQAAVALGQLESIEERKNNLCRQYSMYKRELSKYGRFIEFDIPDGEIPLWIEFICHGKKDRDRLHKHLSDNEIGSRLPWKPFVGTKNASYYAENVLWLPNGPSLEPKTQSLIIKVIKQFYED